MIVANRFRFEEGKNIYTQRRSLGGFVGVIVDNNGYRFTCDTVPVEARRELICKNFEQSFDSSASVESEEGSRVELESMCPQDASRSNFY